MKKLIFNTLMAWIVGYEFGMLLGLGDWNGVIYYDLRAGICAGALFAGVFAATCWVVGCTELGGKND